MEFVGSTGYLWGATSPRRRPAVGDPRWWVQLGVGPHRVRRRGRERNRHKRVGPVRSVYVQRPGSRPRARSPSTSPSTADRRGRRWGRSQTGSSFPPEPQPGSALWWSWRGSPRPAPTSSPTARKPVPSAGGSSSPTTRGPAGCSARSLAADPTVLTPSWPLRVRRISGCLCSGPFSAGAQQKELYRSSDGGLSWQVTASTPGGPAGTRGIPARGGVRRASRSPQPGRGQPDDCLALRPARRALQDHRRRCELESRWRRSSPPGFRAAASATSRSSAPRRAWICSYGVGLWHTVDGSTWQPLGVK